jgi:hypothetical protein
LIAGYAKTQLTMTKRPQLNHRNRANAKPDLLVKLMAGDTVIDQSDDVGLWQRVLAEIRGVAAPKAAPTPPAGRVVVPPTRQGDASALDALLRSWGSQRKSWRVRLGQALRPLTSRWTSEFGRRSRGTPLSVGPRPCLRPGSLQRLCLSGSAIRESLMSPYRWCVPRWRPSTSMT